MHTSITYNPFDPSQVDHDREVLEALRRQDPVYEFAPGTFLMTRFEDVSAALLDTTTFPQGGFAPGGVAEVPLDELPMGQTNPPVHGRIRRTVASTMNVHHLDEYESQIRAVAERLVADLATGSSADLVKQLTMPLPAEAILRLCGIPLDQMDAVLGYTADFILNLSAGGTPAADAAVERMGKFDALFLRLLAEARQVAPEERAPMMRALLDNADGKDPVSDRRLLTSFASDMVVAGLETTVHLVGNILFLVLSQDGLYARLREHPEEREAVIEEALRHTPAVNIVFRRASRDVQVGETLIPQDSMVVLSLASANADEQAFECPHAFRPGGAPRRTKHIAFGRGPHLCVGAPLARLEARCVLDAVLDNIPHMELAPGEEYQRIEFISVRGPRHLNVTIGTA